MQLPVMVKPVPHSCSTDSAMGVTLSGEAPSDIVLLCSGLAWGSPRGSSAPLITYSAVLHASLHASGPSEGDGSGTQPRVAYATTSDGQTRQAMRRCQPRNLAEGTDNFAAA
jgi:hypothetical protein